jgi:hypothetical protein
MWRDLGQEDVPYRSIRGREGSTSREALVGELERLETCCLMRRGCSADLEGSVWFGGAGFTVDKVWMKARLSESAIRASRGNA